MDEKVRDGGEAKRKKTTSTDVARLAGVSQTTVSMVLGGKMRISVSDETRKRVMDAARELNYIPPERERKKMHKCARSPSLNCKPIRKE